MTLVPTCEDLFRHDEGDVYIEVQHETETGWRHGHYVCDVFHRASDDSYWSASYRVSTGGDTNELREGFAEISRVIPVEKTIVITEYKPYLNSVIHQDVLDQSERSDESRICQSRDEVAAVDQCSDPHDVG
jgi:hypothetical protein